MNKKLLALTCTSALLAGCAGPQGMYDWGDYQETLFVVYHEPDLKEEALKEYLAFVESGGTAQHPIAPGLLAEAGTFMLEQGNVEEAIRYYKLEYDTWPESQPMLGLLIENLEAKK